MKAALVTGASKGIGAATARLLQDHGYFVYLHGRNQKDLQALEKELGQQDSVLIADFADPQQIGPMIGQLQDRIAKHRTHLQVLINNAGIFHRHGSEDARSDLWRTQIQVNLLSAVQLTEKLIPILKAHPPASIVNVSSTLGLRPTAGVSAYSASKAAMVNWTQSLALELGPDRVRVNCVCPGLVDTPIHDFHFLPEAEKSAALERLAGLQPLGRIGDPKEIAEAIVFLAGSKSSWTTGAVLSVDGGIHLK
jgi:NAD(P)-dependent dehydrogenase (short-subunit alcohol dehydrogenase family)